MQLDRKEVDKVLSLKRTFDIITGERLAKIYHTDLACDRVKLKISITSYKNTDGDLIVVSNITICSDRNHDFRIKFNTRSESFLINLGPATRSSPVGIFYDKDVVLDKINSFTYEKFDDVNKAVIDLMLSYKE